MANSPAHAADAQSQPAGRRRRRQRAAGANASDLQAKARKNFKLGIMDDVYAHLPIEEAARHMKEDGFTCTVLCGKFKDVAFDFAKPDWDAVKRIRTAFEKNSIQIVGLFGYYNVVAPNLEHREAGEHRMQTMIENWERFGSPIISTETGSFNPKSEWETDPKNDTEEGYKECRAVFEKLARAAEKTKAVIAIEGYWKNVIGTPERAERLFKDISSPSLKLTMDPCNYFRNEDLPKMKPMLRDLFKRVGSQTVLAHAKDVKGNADGSQSLPAAGLGSMDYPVYLRLLAQLDRELPLIIEHLEFKDRTRARDYVKAQIEKV
jgi:sugar phosphate isomerase/epimerase